MKKVIIIIFLITTGAAYYMGTKVNENLEPVVTIIDLTDSERKQIAQDAVLGWIHPDSILTVTKIKWEVKDSINWTFIDSLEIRDSVAIKVVYIPFYEGKDTIVTFDETVNEVRVELSLAIKPRFFPTYRKFLTDVKLNSLTVTIPDKEESWWAHRWALIIGYGLQYGKMTKQFVDHTGEYPVAYEETSWCWTNGYQLTLGFRVF